MSFPMIEPTIEDVTDFDNVIRGFVGTIDPCIVKTKDGRQTVWNNEDYAFLQNYCPPTVNPKLWRQRKLCLKHGLFEVAAGIYQLRGLDLSNMTIIEGRTGVVIVDPLVSIECAQAALALYRRNFYLTRAHELRKSNNARSPKHIFEAGRKSLSPINMQSTIENWFDALPAQLDGQRAGASSLAYVIRI